VGKFFRDIRQIRTADVPDSGTLNEKVSNGPASKIDEFVNREYLKEFGENQLRDQERREESKRYKGFQAIPFNILGSPRYRRAAHWTGHQKCRLQTGFQNVQFHFQKIHFMTICHNLS
jgi:hypothetical protein